MFSIHGINGFFTRLDGVTVDGSSGDQPSGVDRPLTQPGGGSSSPAFGGAVSRRGGDGGGQAAAGYTGKPPPADWSAGESYAEVLNRRRGGPQEVEPSQVMDTLLNSPGGCPHSRQASLPLYW